MGTVVETERIMPDHKTDATKNVEYYKLADRALRILDKYPAERTSRVANLTIKLKKIKMELIEACDEVENVKI